MQEHRHETNYFFYVFLMTFAKKKTIEVRRNRHMLKIILHCETLYIGNINIYYLSLITYISTLYSFIEYKNALTYTILGIC